MVLSESVHASNAQGHRIKDFVGIFVGGTGGIGESTALELFERTVRPRIYIVGRYVSFLRVSLSFSYCLH